MQPSHSGDTGHVSWLSHSSGCVSGTSFVHLVTGKCYLVEFFLLFIFLCKNRCFLSRFIAVQLKHSSECDRILFVS